MAQKPLDQKRETHDGVTIGDVPGGIRGSIIAGRDVILGTTERQRAMRNRHAMLELVKSTWIKGVLERSLHGAAMIELGMEEHTAAVERPWDTVVQMPDQEDRELPYGTKIIDVFDEANGSLLILGKPGSGKTTTLLELARDAIARAECGPTEPIPVVFNLSSWRVQRRSIAVRKWDRLLGRYLGPFGEWLLKELNTMYQMPKRIARRWIESDNLLLLLDGLDEVAEGHREACVEAINEFRQEHLVALAVCSRSADYQALTTQLRLRTAVLLQPLKIEQIESYLAGTSTRLLAVRQALEEDSTLLDLVQTPLMLSVMVLAYRGIRTEELIKLDTVEARRRYLFGVYVQRMFERRTTSRAYSVEQTLRWLPWLAHQMLCHSESTFLVEKIQPTYLDTKVQRWLHTMAWHALAGPIMGLALGLLAGMVCNPPSRAWWLGILGGLAGGLFVGLLGAPVSIEPFLRPASREPSVWRSLKTALALAVLGGMMAASAFGLAAGRIAGSFFGISVALVLMLYLGGFPAIQHATLRVILHFSACVPWNLTPFLDYAAECIVLRKVGEGYMFIHDLLQDYFASLYEERHV